MACKKCGVALGIEQKKGVFTIKDTKIGPYCDTCWPLIKTCSICNAPKEWQKDIQHFDNGMFICDTCKPTYVKVCQGCGEESIMNKHDPESGLCHDCYSQVFKCTECGKYHMTALRWLDQDNGVDYEVRRFTYPGIYHKHNNNICVGCFDTMKHRFKKMEVHECKRCQAIFNKVSRNKDGGTSTTYCSHCWNNYAFKCGDCGEVHIKTNKTLFIQPDKERDAFKVCTRCAGKYYVCKNCTTTYIKKDMPFLQTGKGEHICYKCSVLNQCSKCGKYKDDTKMSPTKNLCSYCASRVNGCAKCGQHTIETCHHHKVDKFYCRKCASSKGLSQLWPWNHKPYPIVHGNPEDLIFGIENEMSCKPKVDHRKVLASALSTYPDDFLTAMYDSSVFNGFEIVTNPMTFDHFKSVDWGPLFDSKDLMSAEEVETQNYYNEDKGKFQKWTGLHCHLSKSHFHTHHLYKFMNFIYSNQEFIHMVAERKANEYCANFPNYKEVKLSSKNKLTKKRLGIHMPNRTITVELRFFAGCHTKEMFHKDIEFVQSLYDFTLDASRSSAVKVNDYLAHVTENRNKFPFLADFLRV